MGPAESYMRSFMSRCDDLVADTDLMSKNATDSRTMASMQFPLDEEVAWSKDVRKAYVSSTTGMQELVVALSVDVNVVFKKKL